MMGRHVEVCIWCVTLFELFHIVTVQVLNVHDKNSLCKFKDNIYLTDNISSVDLHNNMVIYWSCKTQIVKEICPQNSVACLKDLQNKENNANLGSSFKIIQDESNSETYYLQSENGEKCKKDPKKNYTINISFDETSLKPRLLQSSDECVFDIRMLHPTAEPPCTKRVNGFLLDFRNFMNDFTVTTEKNTYIFNLCKSATGCNDSKVSSCIIGTDIVNFGEVANKKIDYNEEDGSVQFYLYSGSGKSRLTTQVDLKCDWEIPYIPTPKYLDSSRKKSKFIIHSPLGCIKLPMDCKYKDLTNYDYDLSKLYKSKGAWNVSNTKNKVFKLNICGPLENEPGSCKDRHSQICNIQQNLQLSYGSILTNKRIEGDILKVKLSYGSLCPENSSVVLTTDLTFKCSAIERGPKLVSDTNCGLDILWETPEACPQHVHAVTNLDIHDNLGRRNLSSLCMEDKNHTINNSSYIRYNLCKPLQKPCNNIANTSICLHDNEKEAVLGYYRDEKLYNRNGVLSMEFLGEACKSLNVSFSCNYNAIGPQVSLHKHDNCAYSMNIDTSSACVSKNNLHPEDNCVIQNNNKLYNLTALALSDHNYIINGKNGIQYIMNVCNPVVTGPKALCKQETNACIYNQTEPNIKYKFFSIGSQAQQLTIDGDKLSLTFDLGDWCRSSRKFASGIIYFNCSNDHESGPILLSEKDCFYEFSWTTRSACPKSISKVLKYSNCLIPTNNKVLNLADIESREFVIPYGNESNFTFNVCLDNYTEVYKSGKSRIFYSNRTADEKSIAFDVEKKCQNEFNKNWNKVNISFSCEEKDEGFEFLFFTHCTVYVTYRSKHFCKEEYVPKKQSLLTLFKGTAEVMKNLQNIFIKADIATEETNYEKTPHKSYSSDKQPNSRKISFSSKIPISICDIVFNSHTISLNNFTSTLILKSGALYSIGLNSDLCSGYICKGNVSLASLETCPDVFQENADLKVTFNNTNLSTGVFTSTIILKCNFTMEMPKIESESNSSLILTYPLHRLCVNSGARTTWITLSIILVVLLIIIIVVFVYKKRLGYWIYTSLRRDNKSRFRTLEKHGLEALSTMCSC